MSDASELGRLWYGVEEGISDVQDGYDKIYDPYSRNKPGPSIVEASGWSLPRRERADDVAGEQRDAEDSGDAWHDPH